MLSFLSKPAEEDSSFLADFTLLWLSRSHSTCLAQETTTHQHFWWFPALNKSAITSTSCLSGRKNSFSFIIKNWIMKNRCACFYWKCCAASTLIQIKGKIWIYIHTHTQLYSLFDSKWFECMQSVWHVLLSNQSLLAVFDQQRASFIFLSGS